MGVLGLARQPSKTLPTALMPRPNPPNSQLTSGNVLLSLEERQDDVLLQLAELEQRVERTLTEFLALKSQEKKAA
jgi:hypothetical protein